LPQGIRRALDALIKNKIVLSLKKGAGSNPRAWDEYIDRLRKVEGNRLPSVIAFAITFVFQVVFLVPQHLRFKNVVSTNLAVLVLVELWDLLAYYAVMMIAFRGVVFSWWIISLFRRFRIRTLIIHPDGCAGLGELGTYLSKTGYIIGLFGFILGVVVATESRQLTGQYGQLFVGPLILTPLDRSHSNG